MECETGILQQWVQAIAVQRRRIDPRKGLDVNRMNSRNANANHRLNRKGAGTQFRGQTAPEYRYRQAIQDKDEGPKQHGAFVIAPNAG